MGKKLLTGLLTVLAFTVAALDAQAQVVRVTAERTSVRDAPATSGAVIATVMKGEELDVLETSGSWLKVRVRSCSREGLVHRLFVEQTAATSPSTTPAAQSTRPASPPATNAGSGGSTTGTGGGSVGTGSSSSSQRAPANPPQPGANRAVAAGFDRHMGVGLTTGGLSVGFTPSFRMWTDGKMGFELNASFYDSYGYSVTALSPSLMMRIGDEPKRAGIVSIAPYWGAGITYWRFSNGYYDYYCGLYVDCDRSSSSIGFGGFGGAEFTFDAVPKLAVSANLGFYSSPDALGYGGLYMALAGHWYFK
jgi:hypothetical protein